MTTPNPLPCARCEHTDTHTRLAGCTAEVGADYCPCAAYVAPVAPSPTPAQSRAARDAAMAQVDENADADWLTRAADAVDDLAHRGEPFNVDDVWDLLAAWSVPAPREPRALGPVMYRAARDGVIVSDGWVTSRRRHQAPIRMYVAARQ